MKRVLLYAATAVLLGAVTMVAPLMLLKPAYYRMITSRDAASVPYAIPAGIETLDEGEGMVIKGEALKRAVSPSNLSSAGLMVVPSFLLALGVSLYLRKRMF